MGVRSTGDAERRDGDGYGEDDRADFLRRDTLALEGVARRKPVPLLLSRKRDNAVRLYPLSLEPLSHPGKKLFIDTRMSRNREEPVAQKLRALSCSFPGD